MLSQAMYHARELAMSRMEAEADELRADGIVGVRLDVEMKEFGSDIAEFIAVGTAVQGRGGRGRRRRREVAQQQEPAVHLRPVRAGLLDAHPGRLRAARHGDGLVRLPRRAPAAGRHARQHRQERGARAVHPGAVRRARAGHEPDAGRGRGAARRGHRRRPAPPAQPHLGLAHHRVLRDRHRGAPAAAPITSSSAPPWCSAWTPDRRRASRRWLLRRRAADRVEQPGQPAAQAAQPGRGCPCRPAGLSRPRR